MNKRKAFIPISALMVALLLALVAAMTPFVAGPDRAYAQSADTTLYVLGISADAGEVSSSLTPAFVPSQPPVEGGHTAYAANDVTTVTVTANASHSAATVAVKAGATESSATAVTAETDGTFDVTLEAAGSNTVILITVTAPDRVGMATYMVTVERGATGSEVTTLSALKLMDGSDEVALNETFASGTLTYTANAAYATRSVEVMATPTNSGATVAVKSDKDSDVRNNVVDLSEGANVITVTVTAADKATTGDYTVTVTRIAGSVSAQTTLAALTVNDGTNNVSLSPRFASNRAPASGGYTAKVDDDVATVTLTTTPSHVNATVAVTSGATDDDDDQTVVSGVSPFSVTLRDEGLDTVILVTVTAQDAVSKTTYKVTVERDASSTSAVATLSALSLMAGGNEVALLDDTGAPAEFASDTNAYTANVSHSMTTIDVMATPTNRGATVDVESDKDSNVPSNRVDLSEGANVITVTVTAADGTTEGTPYTVTVARASGTDAMVTTLTALSITFDDSGTDRNVPLMPEFASDGPPASSGYTAYVANAVAAVDLTATATHTGATVAVTSGATDDDDDQTTVADPSALTLQATGSTVILIKVTAADKVAASTYKVTVMRGAAGSEVTTLSALKLMAGGNNVAIDPAFVSTTRTGYTASVPYSTMMVEVMATPSGRGATVAVKSDKDSSVQNNVVDLSEGANLITVTVTAADKVTTGDYTLTVTRVAGDLSTDTTLAVLTLSTGALMPAFVANSGPAEGGYTGPAGTGATVDLTVSAAHTGATLAVMVGATEAAAMKADPETGASPYTVTLQATGLDTVILVTVTAADLATTATYKITISRPADAADDNLKELSLGDDVALMPAFDPTDTATVAYTSIVELASVTVAAMPRNSGAKVTVASNKDDDIQDNVVDLAEGVNVITITVRPANATDASTDKTYTIRVRRDLSDDASLSSLGLKYLPMNMMEGMPIDLSPAFDSGVMAYSADAANAEEITVTAKATHSEAMVSVTVNGTVAMKTDVPTYWDMLGCPAMNDSVRAYDDHDHPDNATSPYCTTYNMDATHPGLMGDAKDVVDRTFANYYDVPLMVGNNTIRVMVTAEDGRATETYTVTVTREDMSDEARLLRAYDVNNNDSIDDDELNTAIGHYLAGDLTPADMNTLIGIYLGG